MRNSNLTRSSTNRSTWIQSAASVRLRQRQPLQQAISPPKPPLRTTCFCRRKVPLSRPTWTYRSLSPKTRIGSRFHYHREEVINSEKNNSKKLSTSSILRKLSMHLKKLELELFCHKGGLPTHAIIDVIRTIALANDAHLASERFDREN